MVRTCAETGQRVRSLELSNGCLLAFVPSLAVRAIQPVASSEKTMGTRRDRRGPKAPEHPARIKASSGNTSVYGPGGQAGSKPYGCFVRQGQGCCQPIRSTPAGIEAATGSHQETSFSRVEFAESQSGPRQAGIDFQQKSEPRTAGYERTCRFGAQQGRFRQGQTAFEPDSQAKTAQHANPRKAIRPGYPETTSERTESSPATAKYPERQAATSQHAQRPQERVTVSVRSQVRFNRPFLEFGAE